MGGDVVLDHTAQGQDLVPFEGRGRAGQPQKRAVQHQRKHAEARRHPDPPRRHDRALRNGLPAQPGPHGRRLFTSSPFLILLAPEDSAARRCELAPLLSTIQRTSSSRVPETAPPPRCGARRRSSTPPGSSEPRNRRRRGALKGISGSIDRTRNNGFGDIDRQENSLALFVQDEWTPMNALFLTAGLRDDDYDTFGRATTGRATAAWLPVAERIKVRTSYGTGFRSPSFERSTM